MAIAEELPPPAAEELREVADAAPVPQPSEELRPGAHFGPDKDLHILGEELGSGAAARVFACVRQATGEQLAVKVINLQRLQLLGDLESHLGSLDREVRILRQLRHDRIVRIHNVFRTENWYFLVMERIRGGELFDQIVQHKSLSELESRYVFRQLLMAVGYMHSKHVIHRDLKPENILVASTRRAPPPAATGNLHEVKIADFGLSKVIGENLSFAKTFVGTPQYYAPEVISVQTHGGTYGREADFWGLGVVLFVMLCGRYPFDGKKMPLEEQIRTANFTTSTARWRGISEDAKDLVRGLLRVNPAERLSLEQCAAHPWVVAGESAEEVAAPAVEPAPPVAPPGCSQEAGAPELRLTRSDQEPHSRAASRTIGTVEESRQPSTSSTALSGRSVVECSDDGAGEAEADSFRNTFRRLLRGSSSRSTASNASGRAGAAAASERRWRRRHLAASLALLLAYFGIQYMGPWLLGPAPAAVDPAAAALGGGLPPPSRGGGLLSESSGHAAASTACPALPELFATPSANVTSETIFRLSELLRLQVSIAGSLEMACLAFRHADSELAEVTHQTSRQARDLFAHAAEVVSRYAQVAQQVSQSVLPDLHLAVQEREPSLAASLLDMVKSWVGEMKKEGEETRRRYTQLQAAVLGLVRRAQNTKTGADQRLAAAVQQAELEASRCGPASAAVATQEGSSCAGHGSSGASAAGGNTNGGSNAVVERAAAMTGWTQRLFAQLDQLASTGAGGPSNGSSVAGSSPGFSILGRHNAVGDLPVRVARDEEHCAARFGDEEADLAWRRDLLDLLFLIPGVAHSLPWPPSQFEDDATAAVVQQRQPQPQQPQQPQPAPRRRQPEEEEDDEEEAKTRDPGQSADAPPHDDAAAVSGSGVVPYVHGHGTKSEAELATQSSLALWRALRELQRVDGILEGCSSFWANMDGTVQKLAQMKEHTESLLVYAGSSPRLRERFEQRLVEYTNFWGSLERLSRQYCADHQAALTRMNKFIREVTGRAELLDIAESAKAGLAAAAAVAPHRGADQAMPRMSTAVASLG